MLTLSANLQLREADLTYNSMSKEWDEYPTSNVTTPTKPRSWIRYELKSSQAMKILLKYIDKEVLKIFPIKNRQRNKAEGPIWRSPGKFCCKSRSVSSRFVDGSSQEPQYWYCWRYRHINEASHESSPQKGRRKLVRYWERIYQSVLHYFWTQVQPSPKCLT